MDFLTNKEYVSQKSNIKRILVNNANKTFLHRFYFETFKIPNIINNIKPDLVLSLQNLELNLSKIKFYIFIKRSHFKISYGS